MSAHASLTVADVIESLKMLPQGSPIYFGYPDTDEPTCEWHIFGVSTAAQRRSQ